MIGELVPFSLPSDLQVGLATTGTVNDHDKWGIATEFGIQSDELWLVAASTIDGNKKLLLASEMSIDDERKSTEIDTAFVWEGLVVFNMTTSVAWYEPSLPLRDQGRSPIWACFSNVLLIYIYVCMYV